MKIQQFLLTALAAGSLCSAASAQTVIDIVGSTAARAAVQDKILEIFASNGSLSSYAYSNPPAASLASNNFIFHGSINGAPVIIRAFFSGSVNGVRDIALQTQQTGLYAKNVFGTATGAQVATAGNLAPASTETAPEIGFSDVFASSTGFTAPSTETSVAIIPFKWFKNDPASSAAVSAKITNVTQQAVVTGYTGSGAIPLSTFSGLVGDVGTPVRVSGRSSDSGTRITAMAEAQIGVFDSVAQYGAITVSSGVITSYGTTSNNGASSGSNIATWLGGTNAIPFIAYLGPTDWQAAVDGAAVELPYNGVAYSEDAVRSGRYTFWGFLHQNHNGITGTTLDVFNRISDALIANPENGLIANDDVTFPVTRIGDGARVEGK